MDEPIAQEKYDFQLLPEEVADEDLFEDKTHEKVATTLFNIISNHNGNGQTIGLVGSWGCGKSTVIDLFRKKFQRSDNKNFCFYFDAWAHEGDHLRRIFLESLIKSIEEQLNQESKNLERIKKKVSNREKETNIKTKKYATIHGTLLAVALLFVPIGVAIISASDLSNLTLKWTGDIDWMFLLGLFLSSCPVLLFLAFAAHKTLKIYKDKKKLSAENEKGKNPKSIKERFTYIFSIIREALEMLPIINSDSSVEITQEVSEENERSSVEFEQFFTEIFREIKLLGANRKTVMIVDNLDRVASDDALKIWSTLQTFFHHRNTNIHPKSPLNKIWIIVPFDENGLAKLWENKEEPKGCAAEFFDKCFQLRLEVPPTIFTRWKKYAHDMADRALLNWPKNEKDTVIEILEGTRDNLTDALTPRHIKRYINQIGLMRQHIGHAIPTSSIAYYVVYRFLKSGNEKISFNDSDIQDNNNNNQKVCSKSFISEIIYSLPKEKEKHLVHEHIRKHLAGIIFGVDPNKGNQLLIERAIESALRSPNNKRLIKILEDNKQGFWTVFNSHIKKVQDLNTTLLYSQTVYNLLWEDYKNKCVVFLQKVSQFELSFPDTKNILSYESLIHMLIASKKKNKDQIWKELINKGLREALSEFGKDNIDLVNLNTNDLLMNLKRCVDCLGENDLQQFEFPCPNIEFWILWAKTSLDKNIPAFKWVAPQKEIFNKLPSVIEENKPIKVGVKETLLYVLNADKDYADWSNLVKACKKHIFHKNGEKSGNSHSPEVIEILTLLALRNPDSRPLINEIVKSGQFYNLVIKFNTANVIFYSAILMAFFFRNSLHTIDIPSVNQSQDGVDSAQNHWKRRKPKYAIEIWNFLKENNQLALLWDLAEDSTNTVISNIFPIAINENNAIFFNETESLKKLSLALNWTKGNDEIIDPLVRCFLENSKIIEELKEDDSLNIVEFAKEIKLILDQCSKEDLLNVIAEKLLTVEKNMWDNALLNHTDLTTLTLTIADKKTDLGLKNAYYDSIIEILTNWANNKLNPSKELIENWAELVKLLGNSFYISFQEKATSILGTNLPKITQEFFESNKPYINFDSVINRYKDNIQDAFHEAIKNNGNFRVIEIIRNIITEATFNQFIPDAHRSDIFREPFNKLLKKQEEEDKTNLLLDMAKIFNIKIDKDEPEEKQSENDSKDGEDETSNTDKEQS